MKTSCLFKSLVASVLVFAGVVSFSSQALAWNWGVHVYVASKLAPKDKMDAAYGSTTPDMFIYAFDNPCLYAGLEEQLHENPLPLWSEAVMETSIPPRAAGFGFVSHNDSWGADYTAHHNGITFGQGEGYIIAKAEIMLGILKQVPDYNALNVPDEVGLIISHELLEGSVDILLKRLDPQIGRRLFDAAMGRSKELPDLIADTYAAALADCQGISESQAHAIIEQGEAQWRAGMLGYAAILNQKPDVAVMLLAQQEAALAGGFLAANGIDLPPGTDLAPLAEFIISTGIDLCKDDFAAEIRATTNAVGSALGAHGVSY
jgi:hypothetical protein